MDTSKIMMFPEVGNNNSIDPNLLLALNNNGGFGGICSYYDIDETSEEAAYLIGHLVQRMYKMFTKIVKRYV